MNSTGEERGRGVGRRVEKGRERGEGGRGEERRKDRGERKGREEIRRRKIKYHWRGESEKRVGRGGTERRESKEGVRV